MPEPNKLKCLFVCTANVARSRTAEDMLKGSAVYEVKSAGVHPLAETRVTQSHIDWADKIFVMNERRDMHWTQLEQSFDMDDKDVIDLDIPDVFERGAPELVSLLETKLAEHLEL